MFSRNGNLVTFTFGRDELFDACALKSAYLSRVVKDADGGYAGENLALTEDEEDAFDSCLRECLAQVWGVVGKMCPDGEDALDGENEITFKLLCGDCPDRVVKVVDGLFPGVLLYGVLNGWFALCGDLKLAAACKTEFETGCRALWDATFRMRIRSNG